MNGTSPKLLRLIPLIIVFLTALACTAIAQDNQTLIKKAEGGDPEQQFHIGVAYANGEGVPKDFNEAAKWWQKAAEQGLAEDQINLGIAYDRGQGVPKDYAEAAKWWQKAAEQGVAEAQNNLGIAYYKGQGVPKDFNEAAKWWQKAAGQGHAGAQCNLGIYYDDGQGVPQDYLLAYFWWSLATAGNTGEVYNRCVNYRDRAARQLTPEQLEKAQQMTREWDAKHPRQ